MLRISNRLSRARAELADAKIEFDAAFSAEGFNPTRAEKAQSWLTAAKAELRSAIAEENGELNRERIIESLAWRLAKAERDQHAVESKFKYALHDLGGMSSDNPLEYNERRLGELRGALENNLRRGGLKHSQRGHIEHSLALVREAQFRLDEVKTIRDQISAIKADIAALKPQRHAA